LKTGSALTLACLVALTGCNKDEKKTVESTFETIAPPLILPKVTSQPVILPKAADSVPLLDFGVKVGNQINSFYQQGNIAAHLLMRSSAVSTSAAPRLIVAFPAGNSGTAIWFKPSDQPVDWKKQADLKGITLQDTKGRILYGIEASITPGVSKLVLDAGMLGSVRTLRSFDKNTKYAGRRDLEIEENALGLPRAAVADQVVSGNSILWIRDRLDGSAGYSMSLTVTNGYVDKSSTTGNIELIATQNEPLNLVLQSLSGETPLVPLLEADLLNAKAEKDIDLKHPQISKLS